MLQIKQITCVYKICIKSPRMSLVGTGRVMKSIHLSPAYKRVDWGWRRLKAFLYISVPSWHQNERPFYGDRGRTERAMTDRVALATWRFEATLFVILRYSYRSSQPPKWMTGQVMDQYWVIKQNLLLKLCDSSFFFYDQLVFSRSARKITKS